MSAAYERLTDAAIAHGYVVKLKGHDRAEVQCGAHDDSNPSVSVTGISGQVLVHCHAGCDTADVIAGYGLTMRDLFDNPGGPTYEYPDGRFVHRKLGKTFPQSGNTKGRALFHADRIGDATTVYIVEGEKDVLAVEAAGGVAVSSAMGAGKAHLADWTPLRSKCVIVVADKDDPGREHAAQVVDLLNGTAASMRIVEAAVGKDAADHVAAGKTLDEFVAVADRPALALTRLADVTPERVDWLWPGRIPAGKLVTLDGDPSLGKSTLAIAFAAVITRAGAWPDGTCCEHAGDVILMSAEDGLADTVRPRADAAGADVARIHVVAGVPIDDEGTLRPPTLADVAALEDAVIRTGARMLVVDVVMAYLPMGTDSHKDQDIRRVLSGLSAMADRTGCAVLLIRHLNKSGGRDPLYRGGGSIGIVGAARAGLLVAADPDDDGARVLASVKSNLGRMPASLAYRLVESGEHGCARVQWEGTAEQSARDLLDDPPTDDEREVKTEAQNWLQDYLAEQGRAPSSDVKKAWRATGIGSEPTLKRAARTLGVRYESLGWPRVTYWSLHSGITVCRTTPVSKKHDPTDPTEADLHKRDDPTGEKTQLDHALRDESTGVRGSLHSRANDLENTAVSQSLGATGATGADLHKQGGETGQSRQSRQGSGDGATGAPQPPGGVTPDTPGQTGRVERALANGRRNALRNGKCVDGHLGQVNPVSGFCDFCA